MSSFDFARTESDISPALPSDLKEQNRRLVLFAFRDNEPHTAADISAVTGISKLTVKRAIQFFCENGLLESCGKGTSTELGGKKPEIFRFCFSKYLLNITVWPTAVRLAIFDLGGHILASAGYDGEPPRQPEKLFRFIGEESRALLRSVGLDTASLFGVNFSTSGIVDYSRLILKYNVNAAEWGADVAVGEHLREIFGDIPCICAENTGKTIARAVMQKLKEPQRRTLVLFTSWGLSASFVQGGRIQNGRDSLIGEVGHMIIDPNDAELCRCGSRGCLERMVGTARIRERVRLSPAPCDSPLFGIDPDTLTLRDLFAASRSGDAYARSHVAYLADCFAVMLRNVALSFNPEAVVFVGDYADADTYFEERLRSQLSSFRYFRGGSLEFFYDARPLAELDAIGGSIMLQERFFAQDNLYSDCTNIQ